MVRENHSYQKIMNLSDWCILYDQGHEKFIIESKIGFNYYRTSYIAESFGHIFRTVGNKMYKLIGMPRIIGENEPIKDNFKIINLSDQMSKRILKKGLFKDWNKVLQTTSKKRLVQICLPQKKKNCDAIEKSITENEFQNILSDLNITHENDTGQMTMMDSDILNQLDERNNNNETLIEKAKEIIFMDYIDKARKQNKILKQKLGSRYTDDKNENQESENQKKLLKENKQVKIQKKLQKDNKKIESKKKIQEKTKKINNKVKSQKVISTSINSDKLLNIDQMLNEKIINLAKKFKDNMNEFTFRKLEHINGLESEKNNKKNDSTKKEEVQKINDQNIEEVFDKLFDQNIKEIKTQDKKSKICSNTSMASNFLHDSPHIYSNQKPELKRLQGELKSEIKLKKSFHVDQLYKKDIFEDKFNMFEKSFNQIKPKLIEKKEKRKNHKKESKKKKTQDQFLENDHLLQIKDSKNKNNENSYFTTSTTMCLSSNDDMNKINFIDSDKTNENDKNIVKNEQKENLLPQQNMSHAYQKTIQPKTKKKPVKTIKTEEFENKKIKLEKIDYSLKKNQIQPKNTKKNNDQLVNKQRVAEKSVRKSDQRKKDKNDVEVNQKKKKLKVNKSLTIKTIPSILNSKLVRKKKKKKMCMPKS